MFRLKYLFTRRPMQTLLYTTLLWWFAGAFMLHVFEYQFTPSFATWLVTSFDYLVGLGYGPLMPGDAHGHGQNLARTRPGHARPPLPRCASPRPSYRATRRAHRADTLIGRLVSCSLCMVGVLAAAMLTAMFADSFELDQRCVTYR